MVELHEINLVDPMAKFFSSIQVELRYQRAEYLLLQRVESSGATTPDSTKCVEDFHK